MTNQELHQLYEKKVPNLRPFIRDIRWNEDLVQEARLGFYEALKKMPHCTLPYLINASRWKMMSESKKGKSLDNAFWRRERLKVDRLNDPESDGVFSLLFKIKGPPPLMRWYWIKSA